MITKRLLAVQIVLLVGFGAIFLLPHVSKSTPAGIAVALPNVVGAWFGDDSDITPREREILAKDTQFARKIYTGPRGDKIVDRKSTRLNSSHLVISYAVFCLK